MPAQFPANVRDAVTTFTGTTGGATTFASRLITLINAVFGPSNPFGTAATRDAGTAADNVPVLNADGELSADVLPAATDTVPGIIQVAGSLSDATGAATPSQVRGAVAGLTQGFRADRTALTELALNTAFTTPGSGYLIASSGGGGGYGLVYQRGGNPPIFTSRGNNGEALTIQYGAASATGFNNASPTLSVAGGIAAAVNTPIGGTPRAFQILSIDAAAASANRAPKFAFTRGVQGAPGGRPGYHVEVDIPIRSDAGNLLVAFFEGAGKHIRMTADGTGGAGGNPGQLDSNRVAGEAGANGFAFYVRVD